MTAKTIQSTPSLWYKDAVIYELHVKTFCDSNEDGIGDFQGLIAKLDYLQDLGVTALWLLPFYPSPQMDDGYDIADYFKINPDYGTLGDFKRFLREAHKRDIRVITELVINHTSDQHKWFQRARRARPGSVWRDFYVWSDTPEKFKDVRIIFTDTEQSNWAWDPVAQAYYWHRFYSHQPDLNYDNPRVRKEIFRVMDYWFSMGVDGMRLDAIPYLYQREGTNCENLPETHAFLKALRAHVDERFPDRLLLAEANQWPDDAAQYFGDGDECHMAFHFPVMPRLFMALRMEDRFPIIDMLEQSMDIPDHCQWAMFLRNHDELTLEMVTDEERDYMYKAYAQDPQARINVGIRRRLGPLMNNSRRRMELMNSLLFSLPGTPIIYYGDEIGMGDNFYLGDRNAVRTPMQWNADRNAGFSRADAQRLYLPVIINSEYHYTTVNVENQERNYSSLLWFMRRIVAIRKHYQAFGRGTMTFVPSDNTKTLTFLRIYDDEIIFVAANLSRYCQPVSVRLEDYAGYAVEELFSGIAFPSITHEPYALTLAPHTFFWFALKPQQETLLYEEQKYEPIEVNRTWDKLFLAELPKALHRALIDYMKHCRWFAAKGRTIRRLTVKPLFKLKADDNPAQVVMVNVRFNTGPSQVYLLPLAWETGAQALKASESHSQSVITSLTLKDGQGLLYEAVADESFHRAALNLFIRPQAGKPKELQVIRGRELKAMLAGKELPPSSSLLKAEQSNSSIVYDQLFILKLYRRLEEGINPDIELSQQLTEQTSFEHTPAFAGALVWKRPKSPPLALGLMLQWVANETDGWSHYLDAAEHFYGRVLMQPPEDIEEIDVRDYADGAHGLSLEAVPTALLDLVGGIYLEQAAMVGRRVGQLHLAMASLTQHQDLVAEPFSLLYQKSLYQSMRALTLKVFDELDENQHRLQDDARPAAERLIGQKRTVLQRLRNIALAKISALKFRVHGDLHLGQTLYTGKDFIIIDFEGEPARSISERRIKQSALRDVAGMIRSFHYVAWGAILLRMSRQGIDQAELEPWANVWYALVSGVFLDAYRQTVESSDILPADEKDFSLLLDAFLLEKSVYELGYELNNRPEWAGIPLRGLLALLDEKPSS